MKKILVTLLVLTGITATAQVKVGTNPTTINSNAVLEMESTNKGLLLPRVALTSTTSFSPLAAHVAGMTVYNTATTADVVPGIYTNNGTRWLSSDTRDNTSDVLPLGYVSTTVGTTVTGIGTNFTAYFKVGDTFNFYDANNSIMNANPGGVGYGSTIVRTITAINSDTELVIDSAMPIDYTVVDNIGHATYGKAGNLFKNGWVGIGVEKATYPLEVAGVMKANYYDAITNNDIVANGASFHGRRGRGTDASPMPVLSGDVLAGLYAAGRYTTDKISPNTGAMRFVAAADYTEDLVNGNNYPTRLEFAVTRPKNTGRSTRMVLSPWGQLGVGTSTTSFEASLHVTRTTKTGTISSVGTTVTGTGTNFFNALSEGDHIWAKGESRRIATINSDTELTLTSAFTTDLLAGTAFGVRFRAIFNEGDIRVNNLTIGSGSGGNDDNTAVGKYALLANTTGEFNTAIGGSTMSIGIGGVTGSRNTAVGQGALQKLTTGNYNVALGQIAGNSLTTGSSNVIIGARNGYTLTEGNYNIFLGTSNGGATTSNGITTGSANVVIGSKIEGLDPALSNNIIIADGDGNRRINVNELGNVGIGITPPAAKLDVANGSAQIAGRYFYRTTTPTSLAGGVKEIIVLNEGGSTVLETFRTYTFVLNSFSNARNTGSKWIVWYDSVLASWQVKLVGSQNDIASTVLELAPSGNEVQVYHSHPVNSYSIRVNIESINNYSTSGTGPYNFGLDGAMTNVAGNVGIGTTVPKTKLHVTGLPVYLDNATAKAALGGPGVAEGAFFHTGDGIVRVVF